MGLSLEFYAGDASIIGADFSEFVFAGLRDGTRAASYADFSLHLVPLDLDSLSETIARHVGVEPELLSERLIRTVGSFEGEGGAELVEPAWVKMVAAADQEKAQQLAEDWIHSISARIGQQLEVAPESAQAVKELIRLCQIARRDGLDVVHAWYF